MKQIVQDETYGEIIYEESFWLGKKSISIGGVSLERISKKEFRLQDGSTAYLSGGFLHGASLSLNDKTISLTPKVKWYEIALCILPILLTLTWGNIYELCAIVPVVGGALGGAIGGIFSVLGLYFIRSVKPIWLKIVIAIASLVITFGICSGIGYAILSAAA